MVGGHVPANLPDDLVITFATCHEPAFASNQLHLRASALAALPSVGQDVGVTLASSPLVRIQICGALTVERDGQRLDTRLPGRQGRLLFAYLVVNRRDFLPGEDAPWIDEVRDQLTELRLRALECYAAAGLGIGETELAAAVRAC